MKLTLKEVKPGEKNKSSPVLLHHKRHPEKQAAPEISIDPIRLDSAQQQQSTAHGGKDNEMLGIGEYALN